MDETSDVVEQQYSLLSVSTVADQEVLPFFRAAASMI